MRRESEGVRAARRVGGVRRRPPPVVVVPSAPQLAASSVVVGLGVCLVSGTLRFLEEAKSASSLLVSLWESPRIRSLPRELCRAESWAFAELRGVGSHSML